MTANIRKRRGNATTQLRATANPQVSLLGGLLILCLALVCWLMGLIIVYGLSAFWVKPVQMLVLLDRGVEIGQIEQAPQRGGEVVTPASTGQYLLTGVSSGPEQGFQWIDQASLVHTDRLLPKTSIVLERREAARIAGFPLELRRKLEPLADKQQVPNALMFLRQLTEELNAEDFSGMDLLLSQELSKQRKADLDAQAETWRQRAESIQYFPPQTNQPGEVGDELSDGYATWHSPDRLSRALKDAMIEIRLAQREADELKREVARLDAAISDTRLAIRRAEMNSDVANRYAPEACHFAIEQQVFLAEKEQKLTTVLPLVRSRIKESMSGQAVSAEQLVERYRAEVLEPQVADANRNLDAWLRGIDDQPASIRPVLQRYASEYRIVVMQKRPLQEQLGIANRKLSQYTLCLGTTAGSKSATCSPDTLDELQAGKQTDELSSVLAGWNIAAANSPQIVEQIAEGITSHSFVDQSGLRHVLLAVGPPQGGTPDTVVRTQPFVLLLGKVDVACSGIVRAIKPNSLVFREKVGVYFSRWWHFLTTSPRVLNTEGGIWPAIFGTIVLTLAMTLAVLPLGVMAALYLGEYTRSGVLVSIIRVSVNNLAGVPSIIYGVFGFSFFCFTVGAFIDGGPKNAEIATLPPAWWYAGVCIFAGVGCVSFFIWLLGITFHGRLKRRRVPPSITVAISLLALGLFLLLVMKNPFFDGWFNEELPNPTYGKGGILWAALTLALLNLPTVIVTTEEALAAVPNSLRDGSIACGASQWQTIRRIVLPYAAPGIITAAILAIARGASSVAPLMLIGALPAVGGLPIDGEFPYFHGERSFAHLGYQIFALGAQSQNVEASRSMVFTTALLLILVITFLNLLATFLRSRLKQKAGFLL